VPLRDTAAIKAASTRFGRFLESPDFTGNGLMPFRHVVAPGESPPTLEVHPHDAPTWHYRAVPDRNGIKPFPPERPIPENDG